MLGIVLGILMFMILIILHELGHFWAAKKSGVKVEEFGIGMPPKICTLWKDRSGTAYTLNRIPLGGFVSLKGEEGGGDQAKDQDTFQSAKLYKKLIIISAGVIMNILTAFVIFTTIFSIGIQPITILPDDIGGLTTRSFLTPSMSLLEKEGLISAQQKALPLKIDAVLTGSLAERVGIVTGDQILTINDYQVSPYTISNILTKHSYATGNQITLMHTDPDGKKSEKSLTFDCKESCTLGVLYTAPELLIKAPVPKAALLALKEIKGERDMTMQAFGNIAQKLFSSEEGSGKAVLKQLTGPVGVVKFGEQLLDHNGLLTFFGFGAMISLALAFFNILPIPAVDGGRFWTSILQHCLKAKGETFAKIENWVNTIFFWSLMLMGIVILLKDLVVWRGVRLPFIG